MKFYNGKNGSAMGIAAPDAAPLYVNEIPAGKLKDVMSKQSKSFVIRDRTGMRFGHLTPIGYQAGTGWNLTHRSYTAAIKCTVDELGPILEGILLKYTTRIGAERSPFWTAWTTDEDSRFRNMRTAGQWWSDAEGISFETEEDLFEWTLAT